MELPQLSPAAVVGTPNNINPLTQSNNAATVAVVGDMAQKSTQKSKSDTVTISREAMAKATEAGTQNKNSKETQTRGAAAKTSGR